MADTSGSELHKRVERYEAAIAELRASHEDIRDVLAVPVLYEHWKQLGNALGFQAQPLKDSGQHQSVRDLVSVGEMNMSQHWDS